MTTHVRHARTPAVVLCAVALMACGSSSSPTSPTTSTTTTTTSSVVLFEDTFARADADSLGSAWNEYTFRGSVKAENSPWKVQGNTLRYQMTGTGSYIEDFIETAATFPANNITVEFELRAQVATTQAYVGPTAYLSGSALSRGSAQNVAAGLQHLGIATWYRWENRGTRGVVVAVNGTFNDLPTAECAGVNQADFAKHTLTFRNGSMTYSAPGFSAVTYTVSGSSPTDARHLSFGARLYDNGVAQVIEIRNVKISTIATSLAPTVAR